MIWLHWWTVTVITRNVCPFCLSKRYPVLACDYERLAYIFTVRMDSDGEPSSCSPLVFFLSYIELEKAAIGIHCILTTNVE